MFGAEGLIAVQKNKYYPAALYFWIIA
jgi:hypothetical protein